MERQKVAELISLGLTVPTLFLAGHVVVLWGRSAIAAACSKDKLMATEWFILGVASGFAGRFLDNLYWAIPWTADFLNHSATDELMMRGVYFNIFSRQLAGIFSAYCHVRSYIEYRHKEHRHKAFQIVTTTAFALGAVAAAVLLFLNNH